jgi:CheY-like chemotaxis protein
MTDLIPTALLVDDDPEMREFVREFLQTCGFLVVEGRDGLEALQQIQRIRPRVVVMDLAMPRLGGLDALNGIRAFDPSICIVVVTGEQKVSLHHEALVRGASRVLLKPFALEDLWSAVMGGSGRTATPAMRAPATPAPGVRRATHGPQVLIVDEERQVDDLLCEVLAAHGYRTEVVDDAREVPAAVRRLHPDLVLLAVEMPRIAGLEVLSAIHAVAPGLPVVLVSESNVLAKRALEAGAFEYVAKPFDVPLLLSATEAAIRERIPRT